MPQHLASILLSCGSKPSRILPGGLLCCKDHGQETFCVLAALKTLNFASSSMEHVAAA